MEGKVSRDDKGLWLETAAGSRWMLKNWHKKDEKDPPPPDIVSKIDEAMKKGHSQFLIGGDATRNAEHVTVVRLESADVAEKKK